jgi:hypothetical protein
MSKRRIIAFAACYLVVVIGCMVVGLELTMHRFEQGGEPGLAEQSVSLGASVLLAPADQIWAFIGRERFGPAGQWLLLIGNALLWGLLAEVVYSIVRDLVRPAPKE